MSSTIRRKNPAALIEGHLGEIRKSLSGCSGQIERAIEVLRCLRLRQGTLWVLGNGGSMAIAQHFAQDMLKMRGLRAQAVNCPSILTAYTNDSSFENCFSLPLEVLRADGDVLMVFSCSGKSRNYGWMADGRTSPMIAVVGCDGGFLKSAADVCVHVKSENYQVCETAFSVVSDILNIGLGEI